MRNFEVWVELIIAFIIQRDLFQTLKKFKKHTHEQTENYTAH